VKSALESLLGAPVVLEELKRKPGRRCTFRAVGSERTAIVKVYASGRAATVAERVAALSGGPSEPRVPEVLIVEPRLRMVVLSEVPGIPLRVAVLEADTAACRRAGAALGRWHSLWRGLLPYPLKPHTIDRELDILRSHVERAPAAIASGVLSALSSFRTAAWAPVTVVHRDLYEEQVLLAEEVGLIDLDDTALGPPELDIGNLSAHLELLGLRARRDLSLMERAVLEGYASAGGSLDPSLFAHCRGLALLRLACIHRNDVLVERARQAARRTRPSSSPPGPVSGPTLLSQDVRPLPAGLLERVAASAARVTAVDHLGADVKRHRAGGHRTVLEYRFDGLRLFAKRYPGREEALAAYHVLRALWKHGFGPGSPHRVAEPLACFPDWRVLVMRAAPGHHLTALAAQPTAWEEGLRAAAGWLAQLHASSVGMGPREDMAHGVFRLARRAARAGARHPELEGLLIGLIEELAERASGVPGSRWQTQTHGRYHAAHVFVAPEIVTVIDLDRAALADPAKDVGEFLHRLRGRALLGDLADDAAERATFAFLDEYAARAYAVPAGLVYYWSYSVLSSLLRLVELDGEEWERRLDLYRAEFNEIPSRAPTLGGLGGGDRRGIPA
jgi:aminoglycoside phosphotransferase (APT) family kinase protein